MDRRDFISLTSLAGAGLAFGKGAPRRDSAAEEIRAAFELEELTVQQLQDGMRSGRWTSRQLVEQYFARIEEIDRRGPTLRSVIETNPDALAIADSLDAERKAGRVRGLMHGIPVLIKDNIATLDKMQTTAGSLALVGSVVPRDAFIVERLRAAGVVIIGKTNLSEWANFRSTHSTSGWSGRGGQTRNPYALDRQPSGSSSGSGSAAAASLCAVAIGTETDGSITSPASSAALVGIKPTLGLVSRSGVVPIAHSQDTAGPMTRTVADAAALLGAMAGVDARDPATAAARGHIQQDYVRLLDENGLKGARIGIVRERHMGYNRESDRVAEEAIRVMKDRGAIIVDPANLATAGKYDDSEFEVLLYEFKADLNTYLASLRESKVRSLADVIRFNEENKDREMPYFGQEIMLMAEKKGPLTTPAYLKALAKNRRMSRQEGIDAVMNKHKLDAIFAPTQTPASLIDLVNGDYWGGSVTTPAAVAGYPHITVPGGYAFGLPIGVSFFGRAWSEPTLLKIAYAFEQATKVRRAPKYLASAPV